MPEWDTVPVVTVDELRNYMSDISLTPDQWEAAEETLIGVQGELELYLHRPVVPTVVYETLSTDEYGYVRPRVTPVLEMLTVGTIDPVPPYSKENGVWVGWTGDFPVTYRAGVDVRRQKAVVLAILRVAKREIQNNHDDTLSVKDLNTQDNPQEPVGWTEEEFKRLSRLRRRIIT